MTAPNVQRLVNQKVLIIVTLVAGKAEVWISVGPPGDPSHPRRMSIKPLLDAGLGDRESLEYVADIVQIAVETATP